MYFHFNFFLIWWKITILSFLSQLSNPWLLNIEEKATCCFNFVTSLVYVHSKYTFRDLAFYPQFSNQEPLNSNEKRVQSYFCSVSFHFQLKKRIKNSIFEFYPIYDSNFRTPEKSDKVISNENKCTKQGAIKDFY